MITEKQYNEANIIVKIYEEQLGLYNVDGSIPFSEYYNFKDWIKKSGWYEAADDAYDNYNDPDSCFRLNIKELYLEFLKDKNDN